MLIDRIYSDKEINVIVERGLDAAAVAEWPLVALPDYVVAVARTNYMEYRDDPYVQEDLEEAIRLRHGLRAHWGLIVVEQTKDDEGLTTELIGYLASDPYVELSHLSRDGDMAGIFLSDLVSYEFTEAVGGLLDGGGWDWNDNDGTGQFLSVEWFEEHDAGWEGAPNAPSMSAAILKANVAEIMMRCQQPDYLADVREGIGAGLDVTRAVLN
ncbi:hypothetical protein [Cupriavidus pinatubonensis]|uniref:hypothetical protein n=1 Tax=Cupriavidus pinatubonensis TaxID=248026 RepID=UPI00112992F6|nr:hypothetical protein [Cupriavidus pinatubonensis]TPQ30663.1 hypothetical protein C2U69_30845 [Cupriavidus pinatubonensis]